MICKKTPPVLVDIKEDTRVSREYGTIDTVDLALAIYNEALKPRDGAPESDDIFARCCALGAIFNVGRMQGIREERARRRQTHTDSEAAAAPPSEALTATA